jgi:2-phospho-L-lactate guanylyltransferase
MLARPTVHVVVPMKAPSASKSRLVGALSNLARERLVESMLASVLEACGEARQVGHVTVVARDAPAVRRIVPRWVSIAAEPEAACDLGAALCGTLERLGLDGAGRGGVAILMADLPLLDGPTLDDALGSLSGRASSLVVPDQHGTGTSLIAWRGARFRDFRYGPHSFAAHRAALRAAGLLPVSRPCGAGFHDIDTAADIEAVRKLARARRQGSGMLQELAA